VPEGKVNVTDPDSRPIPVGFGFVQGDNAQTPVNEQHIVLAAGITNNSTDFSQLAPMVAAVLRELGRAAIDQRLLTAVAADAGYWNEQQMDEVVADPHIPVLVAPDTGSRDTPKPWLNSGPARWMRARCWDPSTVVREYGSENRQWNRSTVTPNTTTDSSAFTGEAG
jgi:hypothetical protein